MTTIALDRSMRSFDKAGHLHVELSNISKANVCAYRGSEIPDAANLGLDPDRIYNLLRDPDELAKGAETFTGKPLLLVHRPQMAGDHDREITIGAVGDAVFEAPYLKAPLSIWDGEAIALIESGAQQELSCGYFYRADMRPGTFEGERYDGRMVDIVGNHVALVETGRAGPDVVVGDSINMETIEMMKSRKAMLASGALIGYLAPKMAADAAMPDFAALLDGVTAKTWPARRDAVAMAMDAAAPGKVAKDELASVFARLAPVMAADEDDEDEEDKPKGEDEEDDDDKPKGEDDKDMGPRGMDAAAVERAVDAAVAKATAATRTETIAAMNAIREAERAVRPYVGEIAVAMDSAEAVYRFALDKVGVNHKGLHPTALRPVLEAQPVPGAVKTKIAVAMDAAAQKTFAEQFPNASRIRHV